MTARTRVAVLAGGTGGAKLAAGLAPELGGELCVITNIGDDEEFWSLLVCPDTDAVLYRLGGLFNHETGWGVADETFAVQGALERYGEDAWFGLGDRDMATHLIRSAALRSGATMTDAIEDLRRRLGILSRVLPVSNEQIRTRFETEVGLLSFQEFFVRHKCQPAIRDIRFEGADTARATPEVLEALETADKIVIGPSNPLISIAPMQKVLGGALDPERTAVVSPVVAGKSLKGPTVSMMEQLGHAPSALGIAQFYAGKARWFVLDERDQAYQSSIEALDFSVISLDTVMNGPRGEQHFASQLLEKLEGALQR
jgi:LPPG:FO 2-phospho-L-lactate transferase